MRLAELQQHMQVAILDPAFAGKTRLRIHHSHFWKRMRDFIASRHPQVLRLLGEDDFVAAVRRFITACPPSACAGLEVGAGFAAFLAHGDPPLVAELAAYDFARSGAAGRAEEVTLTTEDLANATIVLRLKKRTALVTPRYRFHAIPTAKLDRYALLDAEPTRLLVYMTNRVTRTLELAPRELRAFEMLATGATLRAIAETLHVLGFTPFEAQRWLGRCLELDLLVAGGEV